LAPFGIVTRTALPPPLPHAAAASNSAAAERRTICLAAKLQRMLKKNGRCERVDVTFASFRRAAHFANAAERDRRRVAFVDELDGMTRASRELDRDGSHLRRPRCLVAVSIERKSHHEAARFERLGASHDLSDRRTLAGASHNRSSRRRDRPRRIADRQSDAALAVVYAQKPSAVGGHEHVGDDPPLPLHHLLEELFVVLRA
jgi:hypothetical protein